MIRSKIRSIGFSIMLIIIVAVVSIGIFVVYYLSQSMGGANKFKNTVNEMVSLAKNFYGGSWYVVENSTGYMIHKGGGRYDIIVMNGTTITIGENDDEYFFWKTFFTDTQSNVSPKVGIFVALSNNNEGKIGLAGYYWNSVPNPAQEKYEQARRELTSGSYGASTGMRGNNIWGYSKIFGYGMYIEVGQNVFIMIVTEGISASSDQLQAFASKVEGLLKSLAS
ncbi:MAG: hypothetical protein ACO2ON_02530 [Candidatus Nanopusillus sp.]